MADQTQNNDRVGEPALQRILDLTRKLGAPIELETILSEVIDAGRDVLDAERGTVFLYNAERDELFAKVATGEREIRFPANRGIAGECATCNHVVNVADAYSDSRFNAQIDRDTGFRTRCLLAVPLIGVDDQLVGVMQLLNKRDGVFDAHDEQVATALAAQCAVVIQRARLLEDYLVKQRWEQDLAIAREIQHAVLPETMPEVTGYELGAWGEPADHTGGDIYDLADLGDGRVMLMMADATGHGVGPAISVTQVRAMVRIALRLDADLDAMFTHVNDQLAADLASNRFVTAFIGFLDPAAHAIHYHAGGQGPLLHYSAAEDRFAVLDASTMPMGIMAGMPAARPAPIEMGPGDIFALISDGVYEALDPATNEQFGDDRVQQLIREHRGASPQQIIHVIREAVRRFTGADTPQADDMTAVLVKRAQ